MEGLNSRWRCEMITIKMEAAMRPSIHRTMLDIAEVLSRRSTCARKKVGCVLVNAHGHIVGTGYNGVASGLPHCTVRPCPGAQIEDHAPQTCEALHAEWNALLQCADVMAVRTAYVTTAPCVPCAKMLLNTGCQAVYFKDTHRSWEAARQLFESSTTPRGARRLMYQVNDAN